MSALRDLELRYDGAIPEVLRRAAIAADFEAALSEPRPSVRVRIKHWKPKGIVDRMARVMLRAYDRRGQCHRRALEEAGFSAFQIDRYAGDARAIAAQRLAERGLERPVEINVASLLAARRAIRGETEGRS